ncbi:hypothetical protein [Streptomyces sp. NRRL WC-3742]|uniref:hypothetical protein n=1 Tax=Streptomyces sp. NRRL WC-3742 TaxID=1463934 RepID=UPI00056CA121
MQQLTDGQRSLIAAFPAELAGDAEAVLAVMPASRFAPHGSFPVVVQGEQVSIPERIYNGEPVAGAVESLSRRQRQLLHCLYSRHHDGRVRQRHLAEVAGSADPWVVPYVVRLAGEYVLEILVDIRDALRDLDAPGAGMYGRFIVDNPEFFARTQRRVVSYWSCYYREGVHASFRGYPGCTVLDLLRSAAAESAGRPWPNLAPRGWAEVDGYC